MYNELKFTVLANYKIEYKNDIIPIRLVEIGGAPPVTHFLVQLPQQQVLLHKVESQGNFLWIAAGGISFPEAQELGPAIESQLNTELPIRDSINPFKYKGPKIITVHTCKINGITIKKAQSPFSDDLFYKITIIENSFVILHAAWGQKRSWLPDAPPLSMEALTNLSDFVEACEQELSWTVD